jgi:hypothetical protein
MTSPSLEPSTIALDAQYGWIQAVLRKQQDKNVNQDHVVFAV